MSVAMLCTLARVRAAAPAGPARAQMARRLGSSASTATPTGRRHAVERELLDRAQLRRQHNTLSAQDADDAPFAESIDDYFDALKCSETEQGLVEVFGAAVEKAAVDGAESITEDYALLLAATREKMRLTVEWNDTAKLTEKERVKATASRVGLNVPEEIA